jgi:DNA-binding NarL/FixJ family response regulator
MQVVLADGRPAVRSALRLLLEQDNEAVRVVEVTTAKDLLAQVGEVCPDLVLLDWELAGPRSSELVKTLRAFCPSLSVIAMSSHPETRKVALAAAADAFVSKGDTPQRLLAAVANCRLQKGS